MKSETELDEVRTEPGGQPEAVDTVDGAQPGGDKHYDDDDLSGLEHQGPDQLSDQHQDLDQHQDPDQDPDIEGVTRPGGQTVADRIALDAQTGGGKHYDGGDLSRFEADLDPNTDRNLDRNLEPIPDQFPDQFPEQDPDIEDADEPGVHGLAADNADAVAGIAVLDAPSTLNEPDVSEVSEVSSETGTPVVPVAPEVPVALVAPQAAQAADQGQYSERWYEIQAGFVDDPLSAATRADRFVEELAGELMARINERRGAFSAALGNDVVSTEDLRLAVRDFHALADQLLGVRPEHDVMSSAR